MNDKDEVILRVENVVKDYAYGGGIVRVLDGVYLELAKGDTAAIVGPSGCGKTTLLNIIGSLDQPTSGTVTLDRLNVTTLSGVGLAKFRSGKVGFVFQDHHLLPQLTALENVLLPTLAAGNHTADRQIGMRLLERVDVAHRADSFPARMSGGERQRTSLARALVNDPPLLLCDEPTGNLDSESGMSVVSLLLELVADRQVTVIVVTHNLEHAKRFSHYYTLNDGKLSQ